MQSNFSLDFPYAYGQPEVTANFRVEPEDFQVDENLGFAPIGEGEHVYLHIWKRGENTAWVAEKIAELAQVQVMDVGYCGRKDRHAVTTQWFSIYLPKKELEPAWSALNSEYIKILSIGRHQHKLRRGDHDTNSFIIRLRNLAPVDKTALEQKIEKIFAQGVPNYYGEQRFGRNGNNLPEAQAILVEGKRIRDKQKRGLILSAARSYLFNQVLAARICANNWQALLEGEPQTYPSAPLWGRGRSAATGEALQLEKTTLEPWADWCNGLEHAGLSQERRTLMLKPEATSWRWIDNDLEVSFKLGSGEFATTILRELAILQSAIKTEPASV
ncbi:tRNA pseudouridine synthase D [Cellvibrio zantedeschiae]|uniref:tRNA pseudouridine synthase D n=1 Tax=Cellvibrio zantedeschiae TaxID=1237077 RepID=A0ABQ3AYK7_9GAMM|nr:tRNA pseudouridine(13) synthase TruD [Cellvibrio zantedeschiae]GGY69318.1 tRNA pseudouridine synthase D [Cellvibrio zantedeschiae]